MVMAVIYFMGTVSGLTSTRPLPSRSPCAGTSLGNGARLCRSPARGSVLAAGFLRATFGNIGHLGATEPGAGTSGATAALIEFVLTAGLVSVILGTASGARNIGANAALAVSGYIILAGLWAAPVSGASITLPAPWAQPSSAVTGPTGGPTWSGRSPVRP